jgi:hypothetical protein
MKRIHHANLYDALNTLRTTFSGEIIQITPEMTLLQKMKNKHKIVEQKC